MLAQYYKSEKLIRIFADRNSQKIGDIEITTVRKTLKKYGFPAFNKWHRTSWGYELEFKVEICD
jgi:hypothetical protein